MDPTSHVDQSMKLFMLTVIDDDAADGDTTHPQLARRRERHSMDGLKRHREDGAGSGTVNGVCLLLFLLLEIVVPVVLDVVVGSRECR